MQELEYTQEDLDRAVDKWRGQSRKGFLELCMLSCVHANTRIYGFAIMEKLSEAGLEIGEGSMYPLLARLVKENCMVAEWEMKSEGHPRKYYRLTMFGIEFLKRISDERDKDQGAYDVLRKLRDERDEGGKK